MPATGSEAGVGLGAGQNSVGRKVSRLRGREIARPVVNKTRFGSVGRFVARSRVGLIL